MNPTLQDAPPPQNWGRTFIYDGLAQTDLDMDHHKLLNLDTSNLPISAAPPTIHPPPHQWLHDWDNSARVWTATQPNFSHISGILQRYQQDAIEHVSVSPGITSGVWRGTPLLPDRLPTLNLILAPTGDLTLANHKITNLSDPIAPQDAVNRRFMDFLLQGLNVKEAVRCASNGELPLSGTSPVDNVPIAPGDRVLVKNQGAQVDKNGIWIVGTSHWTRAADADTAAELQRAYVTVREGTINSSTSWVQINALTDPIGIGDVVSFVLFSTAVGSPGPPGEDGLGVPPGGDTGQVLAKRTPEDNDTEWVNPGGSVSPPVYAYLQTAPTGNIGQVTDLGGRMAGLAGYIQPSGSGKIAATIPGFFWNTSPGGQATLRMCVGGGTAPIFNAPQPPPEVCLLVGAIIGASEGGAAAAVPFSVSDVIVLTPGIRYWYDLKLAPATTGGVLVGGVSLSLYEIP